MKSDRPIASISGTQEWEWNRSQAEQKFRDGSKRPPGRRQPKRGAGEHSNREAPIQRKITELEAELERKDRQLQDVITHYERLLAEKDRQLAKDCPATDAERGSTVRSKIVRYMPDRWYRELTMLFRI